MPCDTVTVEEPVNDSSSIGITNYSVASKSPNEVTVELTVKNTIESGNGEYINGTVSITIDGSQADSFSFHVGPGKSVGTTRKLTEVGSGERRVCATAGRGNITY